MNPLNHNPLRKGLAAQRAETHPEADLLNAFVEGSLLKEERRRVVEHLAACDECRAVVALACNAAPEKAANLAPARSGPPVLRFLVPSLATAAAVAITLVVAHQVSRSGGRDTTVAVRSAAPQPPVASTNAGITAGSAPRATTNTKAPAESAKAFAPERGPAPAQNTDTPAAPPQMSAAQTELAPAPIQAASARVQVVPTPAQRNERVRAELSATLPSSTAPIQQNSSDVGAIGGGVVSPGFANTLTTQAVAKASAASIGRPHWRINRQGKPERAFGSGLWQAALPADAPPMRVLATEDAEVWIGGDNAQVYHSADGGQTWSKIALPEKNGGAHTIVHIVIDTPAEITIRASDGTTWTTSDGGASWK